MKTRISSRFWPTTLLVCALAFPMLVAFPGRAAACEPTDPVAVALESSGIVQFTEEPNAGSWKPWLVQPDAVPVAAPPATASAQTALELAFVKVAAATRDASTVETIHRWGDGAAGAPWTEVFLGMIKKYSTKSDRNPPRYSRQIAMFQTAMEDALIAAWNAKYCYLRPAPADLDPTIIVEGPAADAPSYPSEHATVAGVASMMLATFFPEEPANSFNDLAWQAGLSRVAAGANYQNDVAAGLALGKKVAERVLGSRSDDGWNAAWDGSGRITGRCNWSPTPPAYAYPPAEPMWGKVRPWVLASGSALRPGPPPACDRDEYTAAAMDVYQTSLTLTARQKEIALYWAGGPGTETPPGMNLRIASKAATDHNLGTMRHARVLAYVGAALADAAIAAWDAKYAYWWDRPVTTIRRRWDPTWTSFIGTPPFPGYVSGHSTFSAASAKVLQDFFPDQAATFRALATEAANSRLYGGIHARYDNEVGLTLGEGIGSLATARAKTDGAG